MSTTQLCVIYIYCERLFQNRFKINFIFKTLSSETFTCLAVDLELHRSIGFYMIQLYIPSALIVVLSWVSFCLDVSAVPARISLGILTVLTLTNMKTIAVASLPKVKINFILCVISAETETTIKIIFRII